MFTINWTGKITEPLKQALHALKDTGCPSYQPRVWMPESKLYQPPGLWFRMAPEKNSPMLFWLTPPHHPVEVLAALKGLGGPWVEDGEKVQEAVMELRGAPWMVMTRRWGHALGWTPEQTRLVYHLLTPLHVPDAGVTGLDAVRMIGVRAQLYRAAGIAQERNAVALSMRAEDESYNADGAPVREEFWTQEIQGEVELYV